MLKGNTEEQHAKPTLSMKCYEIVSQSLKFQVYLTLISQDVNFNHKRSHCII